MQCTAEGTEGQLKWHSSYRTPWHSTTNYGHLLMTSTMVCPVQPTRKANCLVSLFPPHPPNPSWTPDTKFLTFQQHSLSNGVPSFLNMWLLLLSVQSCVWVKGKDAVPLDHVTSVQWHTNVFIHHIKIKQKKFFFWGGGVKLNAYKGRFQGYLWVDLGHCERSHEGVKCNTQHYSPLNIPGSNNESQYTYTSYRFLLLGHKNTIFTGLSLPRITYKEIQYKPWFYFNHGI